jgi:urocanate hydratase
MLDIYKTKNDKIIEQLQKDKERLDWLADVDNKIANVMLPTKIVQENIAGGLRGMIDAAMEMEK